MERGPIWLVDRYTIGGASWLLPVTSTQRDGRPLLDDDHAKGRCFPTDRLDHPLAVCPGNDVHIETDGILREANPHTMDAASPQKDLAHPFLHGLQ